MRYNILLILILILFFTINIYIISDEKYVKIDSVNIRKYIFNKINIIDNYPNNKITFKDDNIIFLNQVMLKDDIDANIFENLLFNLKISEEDKKLILKCYKKSNNKYFLSKNINIKDINNLFYIFNNLKIDLYYYNLQFYSYKNDQEPISYGRFEYILDFNKELLECNVYIHQNNNSYINFNKNNYNKSDIYLFGKLYVRDIYYYFTFDSLKYLSLNSILGILEDNLISKEILIENNDYKIKNNFIEKIILPSIQKNYVEDGAKNEFGEYVYIKSGLAQPKEMQGLNCSGFVKDVTENYIRLMKKEFKWFPIDEIKKKRDDRELNSYIRYDNPDYDPFFGSDWVRNLIDKINEYCNYQEDKAREYKEDKKSPYFNRGGYLFSNLKEILYRDQQKDPYYFYYIVFNKLTNSYPVMPSYYHIAIIVPYFKDNHFYLRVFESGLETDFINLIKVRIPYKIKYKDFNNIILERIQDINYKNYIKEIYKLNKNNWQYEINKNLNEREIITIRSIFDSIEYNIERVLIFKIPIPLIYFH